MKKSKHVLLGHGSGGKLSQNLIRDIFLKYFSNSTLNTLADAAVLNIPGEWISYTTDSFVVDPLFFPGGNIGDLAIAGTVNDLSVSGAQPRFLSAGFILEEGFDLDKLERIVNHMADAARNAGVIIVCGDTKVVDKGKCDQIFINTSGIGILTPDRKPISTGYNIQPGDLILINGSIGDHGMAVMAARNDLNLHADIISDTACLNGIIHQMLEACKGVKFMRDATRGGLATVLNDLATAKEYGLVVFEDRIPVKEPVRGICELLGFDPMYVANEGKFVTVISPEDADLAVEIMQSHPLGRDAAIIGEIKKDYAGKAWMETRIGGKRIIDMLSGEQLPRIC